MRRIYKSDIARAAGVTSRTLARWMRVHRDNLVSLGLQPTDKSIPPRALQYICHEYGVEMDEL